MAFVLELSTTSNQKYILNYIVAIAREFNINSNIIMQDEKIVCAFDSQHEKLQECLASLAQKLPASLFLKSSSHSENEIKPVSLPSMDLEYPLNLALCPACQKELFDVSSRRYYYPFISCNCCGGNYSFLQAYPYIRDNTSFKFLRPCSTCETEMQTVGLREGYVLNSCHDCAVPVRLVDKNNERYANDAGSFRTMFEVAAKAVNDKKRLLMKTTFGYRIFYLAKKDYLNHDSILLMINAAKITDNVSLITEEFNALLSIERPVMHMTLKNEALKEEVGTNTAFVKYPDDGFTILLGVELQKLGIDFIAYEDVDEHCDADILMDYDLEVNAQKEMRLFVNKEIKFIAEGERVSFPSHDLQAKNVVSITDELVGIPLEGKIFFDRMDHFETVKVLTAHVLEGIEEKYHNHQKYFSEDEASFMSVIAEHKLFNKKCIGAYFFEEPSFLYYDSKNTIRVVPPKNFDSSHILEEIAILREGSDRLVENLEKKLPIIFKKLQKLQNRNDVKLFEAVAIILDVDDESMRGVMKEAMKFVGKGGIQIDTHVKDNRFDHVAFLASIISYQLADVNSVILAYSIFESFGDYFSEIIAELQSKTKAEEIILCGAHFANQSLFSRMQRNLKMTPPKMNMNYPISKENTVVGGVYI